MTRDQARLETLAALEALFGSPFTDTRANVWNRDLSHAQRIAMLSAAGITHVSNSRWEALRRDWQERAWEQVQAFATLCRQITAANDADREGWKQHTTYVAGEAA